MRVLAIDIETSPSVVHAWGLFNVNVSLNQIMESGRTICFAAKFIGERKMHFYSEFHHTRTEMVEAAYKLLDQAGVVLHYNGDRFDIPHLNAEFAKLKMPPPSPFKSIDLLKVVRKQFRFPSNKLQYISEALGFEGKIQHEGHGLWVRCLAGEAQAWATMKRYNIQDVRLLEDLYEQLKPWISKHPHQGLYADKDGVCNKCGSDNLEKRGFAYTDLGKFQQFRCRGCGGWSRSSQRIAGVSVQGVA